MNYQTELNFVRELLKTYRLTFHLFDDETTPETLMPERGWIGELLSNDASLDKVYRQFKNQCKPNIVYQIDDGFLCHHIVFLLPYENGEDKLAYIGPYTQETIGKQSITRLSERYRFPPELASKIEAYYRETPLIEEDTHLLSIVYTFCSHIWGGADKFTTKQFQDFYPINFDSVLKYASKEALESPQDMLYLEERIGKMRDEKQQWPAAIRL